MIHIKLEIKKKSFRMNELIVSQNILRSFIHIETQNLMYVHL